MDLVGVGSSGRYMALSRAGWQWVLDLALAHGWQPRGVEPGDSPALVGLRGYFSNDAQLVRMQDAAALSAAVARALPALIAREQNPPDDFPGQAELFAELCRIGLALKSEYELASTFAQFCRTGAFRIS